MDMYENYPPEIMNMPVSDRANLWIAAGEVGISSKTIWMVMQGIDTAIATSIGDVFFSPPYDPGDFRRCYLLLRLIPEWKGRLEEVANHFPVWKPLIENWDELTAIYEQERENPNGDALYYLYKRMKELLR